jgi:GrpB-like predicted nucleotidyltransferase (UPF0157 family)
MEEDNNKENWPVWATGAIEIMNPDPSWLEKGKHELNQISRLLSPFGVIKMEHFGSTSIPDLPAKPIIDLMAKIQSFDDLAKIIESLKSNNWHYVPPELDGKEWRRFFVKVQDDKRVGHLHLVLENEERWEKQLLFRNKLRQQPNLAKQYAELKRKLAEENKDEREAYTAAKTDFVKSVLESIN